MPAALTTRLERLEAAQHAVDRARHQAAIKELGRTMEPEHIRLVQDWMREHVGDGKPLALPGESPAATIARLRPPALVRAVWILVDEHVRSGSPISLAPEVARVYLEDPHAYPASPCDGCGYRLPIQGKLRPDGSFADCIWYVGSCPVCGHNTDTDEEVTA